MGSVRRPTWSQFLPFLGLNVVVSALTVFIILAVWDKRRPALPPTLTPSPTLELSARLANSAPTATATFAPTPTPVTYRVQPGDTLFAIAQELGVPMDALMAANGLTNADALSVGQVLAIPDVEGPVGTLTSPTPPPATPQATVTPDADAEAPRVEIRGVSGAGALETESVLLLNTGGVASMAGWTLDDGQGRVYSFPIFTLHNNGSVVVHTQAGADTVIDLYWGLDEAIWTPGKVITLRDASGAVQSTFQIP